MPETIAGLVIGTRHCSPSYPDQSPVLRPNGRGGDLLVDGAWSQLVAHVWSDQP